MLDVTHDGNAIARAMHVRSAGYGASARWGGAGRGDGSPIIDGVVQWRIVLEGAFDLEQEFRILGRRTPAGRMALPAAKRPGDVRG